MEEDNGDRKPVELISHAAFCTHTQAKIMGRQLHGLNILPIPPRHHTYQRDA